MTTMATTIWGDEYDDDYDEDEGGRFKPTIGIAVQYLVGGKQWSVGRPNRPGRTQRSRRDLL